MAIADDYKDIGERYRKLSGGWIPREAEPQKSVVQQIAERIRQKIEASAKASAYEFESTETGWPAGQFYWIIAGK